MRSEPHIPLFLWVTTAIVVHALGGGGATEVARRIEETLDIRDFAAEVRQQARYAGSPVEVSLLEEEVEPDEHEPPEVTDEAEQGEADEPTNEELDETPREPDERQPEESQAEPETPADEPEKQEEKPEEEKPEETPPQEPVPELQVQPPPPQNLRPDRRVAVDQHVEDKNQEDNPDAEFLGEHANRVDEQTRAQITSTDGATAAPTMSGHRPSPSSDPGNSDSEELAQSDEAPGEKNRPAGESGSEAAQEARAAQAAAAAQQGDSGSPSAPAAPGREGQTAREAIARSEAQEAMPHTHHADHGAFEIARAREQQKAAEAQRARRAIAGIDRNKSGPMFGLGSAGLTPNGVNLNLSHSGARSIVGADEIARIRKKDGERRLSQHRGGWDDMGLERWKPALENYVASVKPGNQTALNTAHSPFARYLNQIHQRLHQVFAFGFLGHLDKLPADHPLNDMSINTHLEIALDPRDGNIVKMGVTKSSGVTAFDVGALDSVEKAAPYGPPPASIVSFDGNVYLHWEFHREPMYACSTYNAHPYILDGQQKSAPPSVQPPRKPNYEEKKKKPEDKRSGSRSEPAHQEKQPG